MSSLITIERGHTERNLARSNELFGEYYKYMKDVMGIDFSDVEKELNQLPGKYRPPYGCILLGKIGNQVAGCVALEKLTRNNEVRKEAEMKRVFTRPSMRGSGVGSALVSAMIMQARSMGYDQMKLDTTYRLESALAIYRSFGFENTYPYIENPYPDEIFMGLDLKKNPPCTQKPNKKRKLNPPPSGISEIVYTLTPITNEPSREL